MEPEDVDGYFENNNWSQYEDELVEELIRAYTAAYADELPFMPGETIRAKGAGWAKEHAANEIKDIHATTRQGIRNIVSSAVRDGWGTGRTIKAIDDSFIFDRKRARVIARTETTAALGQGAKDVAEIQGQDEKRWRTVGQPVPGEACYELQAYSEKWIPIADPFRYTNEFGREVTLDTIPAHPNCRCVVQYRTKEVHDEDVVQAEFRCPECKRLLGKDVGPGSRILCRHCKKERTA